LFKKDFWLSDFDVSLDLADEKIRQKDVLGFVSLIEDSSFLGAIVRSFFKIWRPGEFYKFFSVQN